MALFKKTQKKEEKMETVPVREPVAVSDLSWVLIRPHMSERAFSLTEKRVYVFDIAPRANKLLVKKAIAQQYKVNPVKVRIVNIPSKKKRSLRTGIVGKTSSIKKAYVYLKKGDTISLV